MRKVFRTTWYGDGDFFSSPRYKLNIVIQFLEDVVVSKANAVSNSSLGERNIDASKDTVNSAIWEAAAVLTATLFLGACEQVHLRPLIIRSLSSCLVAAVALMVLNQ
jgi:hypothetical protein